MFKAVVALGLFATVSGCATSTVVAGICDRYHSVSTGLHLALTQAEQIADIRIREATMLTIETSLRALERCPQARGLR